ncbi:MAG: hypothetical protein MR270_03010 [Erysipelotrichaceae bacterium]|nr:hypothetical protein [Erysipelotrichaceae bacterium]
MAKKENKYIGYIVLSFIPLIGIAWAAVAGIRHNYYVNSAVDAEVKFEALVKEKINSLNDEYPKISGDFNITSASVQLYSIVLNGDSVTTDRFSRTVKLCANPTTHDDNGKVIIDSFQLVFEFFITDQQYTDLCEYYTNDSIKETGYKEYLYETYNRNSPKNSPVYKLQEVFSTNYTNVNFYQYGEEVLIGVSAQTIIDAINELGDLNSLKASDEPVLKQIQENYNNLPDLFKQDVTNYDVLQEAINVVLPAKKLENSILNLPKPEEIDSVLHGYDIETANTAYSNLSDEQKEYISEEAVSKLQACVFNLPIAKVYNYINKIPSEVNDETKRDFNKYVQYSVKYYNLLEDEQKEAFDAEKLAYLQQRVDEYNSTVDDNKKLVLQ